MDRINFSLFCVSVLLVALAPPSAPAQSPATAPEDAVAVIEKARETYQKLRSYQFERTTSFLESQIGAEPRELAKLYFVTASAEAKLLSEDSRVLPLNPDRFLLNVTNDKCKFVFASNDEEGRTEGWWHGPQETIHKTGKGILTSGAVSGSARLKLNAFPFALFEKGVVRNARIVGKETIGLGNEKWHCLVIEGRVKATYWDEFGSCSLGSVILAMLTDGVVVPPEIPRILGIDGMLSVLSAQEITKDIPPGSYKSNAKETKVTLWIDQSQQLLVRSELTSTLQKFSRIEGKIFETNVEEVLVAMTDSFTRLRINEQLPNKLFRFRPPAGAEVHEAK